MTGNTVSLNTASACYAHCYNITYSKFSLENIENIKILKNIFFLNFRYFDIFENTMIFSNPIFKRLTLR